MLRTLSVSLALMAGPALAGPALAGPGADEFIDDRSSPERVLTSLYNAIGRGEYLRAWSYFRDGSAPPYETFRDGYPHTASVELRVGQGTSEGAAGSVHSDVPVVLQATGIDGAVTIYVGCYHLTQVQPAAQDIPPFQPILIDGGALQPTTEPFDEAVGACG